MPKHAENKNAPRRDFYAQPISARQLRQLNKMACEVTAEIQVLRMKVLVLLDQLEGLTFYTDLDIHKLALINTLINTICRLVTRNQILVSLAKGEVDLGGVLEQLLREDAVQVQEP